MAKPKKAPTPCKMKKAHWVVETQARRLFGLFESADSAARYAAEHLSRDGGRENAFRLRRILPK